jgi:hypothetical protein
MCTPAEIASKMRYKLRDFGHYFEVPYTAGPIYTMRLPHPLVDDATLTVWHPDGTVIDPDPAVWELDQRNGILKFKDPTTVSDGVGVSGYWYEWFLDEDLEYAASVVSNQHLYDRPGADASDFAAVECDIIATGGVAQAWNSLLAELALDIDVSTPEGMSIPASERFRQVLELSGYWAKQYADEAALVGVGLTKVEQLWLRRVARLTNRLVPLIREREVDDMRPPTRLLPPIPAGVLETDGEDTAVVVPEPPGGIGYGGWTTIATSGAP